LAFSTRGKAEVAGVKNWEENRPHRVSRRKSESGKVHSCCRRRESITRSDGRGEEDTRVWCRQDPRVGQNDGGLRGVEGRKE